MSDPVWQADQRVVIGRRKVVTIERVTPAGRVIADGRTFDKNGLERRAGKHHERVKLELLTPEIEAEMAFSRRVAVTGQHAFNAVGDAQHWLQQRFHSFLPINPVNVKLADIEIAERLTAAINQVLRVNAKENGK